MKDSWLLAKYTWKSRRKKTVRLINWLINYSRIWEAMALHWSQFKDCISAGPQWFSNLSRGSKGFLGAFCEGAFRDRKSDKAHIRQFIHSINYSRRLAGQFAIKHAIARAFAEGGRSLSNFFRWGITSAGEFLVLELQKNSCACKFNPGIKAKIVFMESCCVERSHEALLHLFICTTARFSRTCW